MWHTHRPLVVRFRSYGHAPRGVTLPHHGRELFLYGTHEGTEAVTVPYQPCSSKQSISSSYGGIPTGTNEPSITPSTLYRSRSRTGKLCSGSTGALAVTSVWPREGETHETQHDARGNIDQRRQLRTISDRGMSELRSTANTGEVREK